LAKKSSSKNVAMMIARAALEKSAREIVIIDIKEKADYADYLVICSGTSSRHVASIHEEIEAELKRKRIAPLGVEGEAEGSWILMDYGVVVVHVFYSDTRYYYDIDGLWLDADRVVVEEKPAPARKPAARKKDER